jgi:predicted O-methyltransferase YrrM
VRIWPALAAVVVVAALRLILDARIDERFTTAFQVMLVMLAGLMLLRRNDLAHFAALAAVAFLVTGVWQPGLNVVETTRSFFGVHRVLETSDGTHRIMYHGTTIHGAERVRETDGTPVTARPEPLTYYYFGGPISEGIAAAREAQGALRNVAVVGLGSGSLACHAKAGESWTFFEIDPEVVRLARDPNVFRFVSACAPTAAVVLGDARLTLKAQTQQFDLIVLDAFSSDAIPVHLLTREALRGYLARLAPHGVIVMHISNRHMELLKVVAAIAAQEGLVTYARQDQSANITTTLQANALVAALARNKADIGTLPQKGWHKAEPSSVAPWTDDYSDVIGAILRKKFGG